MNVQALLTEFTGGILKEIFTKLSANALQDAIEIRIRQDKPLMIKTLTGEYFVTAAGEMIGRDYHVAAYCPSAKNIMNTIEIMSGYSMYAFSDEIKNGFITLPGGHRVGMSGRAVVENGSVKTIKNINGLNIRITHDVPDCASGVINEIAKPGIRNTMIISPPCCGKTTLLRDTIRKISDGFGEVRGRTVGLVDERSEIAGCYMGKPQNDVGIRTDVLDACPKAEGMIMLLRSMSPEVIAVDEIGKIDDVYAIDDIINAGIKLICTAHGHGIEELRKKPALSDLMAKNIFERYIVLGNNPKPGQIVGVFDGGFNRTGGGDA